MPGYLKDFLFYNSGNECPESFWTWSALSLLGHIIGPKVWHMHGRFKITPATYTALIGSPGSGKSTAKDEVRDLFKKLCPELLISSSIQSREDILELMLN